jgi:uncharacterized protein YegP (UPF0339 family)
MGVRRMKDGRYVAFIREANGTMFSAEPRESRDDALEDIFSAMETTGPARVYE